MFKIVAAHANTLETVPTFLFALLYSGMSRFCKTHFAVSDTTTFTGLYHPRIAAAFGALWITGRVVYTFGYAIIAEPEKRNTSGGIFLHAIGTF
jgi:glutathione S-transferase